MAVNFGVFFLKILFCAFAGKIYCMGKVQKLNMEQFVLRVPYKVAGA